MPCWPIRFITSFLGFPRPIYFVFASYCAHEPVGFHFCHVGPLGLLPLFLGFFGPLTLSLPLIVPMGLLVVIPAMLAYWVYYLLSWVSSAHLLCLYLLLCSWVCWLSFLPCWPIGFITSFLGFLRPTYFVFTSYCAHRPVGCHSWHVGLLGLLPLFLGFLGPFTLSLPLIVPMGLLIVIPVTLAHWVY